MAMADRDGEGARSGLLIVSGGQTGVDRAALDAALAAGLSVGGWCPAGRAAEDGPIDDIYPLKETASADPAERTRANVTDSDATLIVISGVWDAGTRLTLAEARNLGRPVRVADLAAIAGDGAAAAARARLADELARWLHAGGVKRLNVAGPRESTSPGIYGAARVLLAALFTARPRSLS